MKAMLVLLWLALVLPSGALALWLDWSAQHATEVDALQIPESLGGWVVTQEDELDTAAEEMLAPDHYLFRRYDAASSQHLWAFVSFYRQAGQLGTGAHSPDVCYPAQGYEITGQAAIRLPLDTGESLRARVLRTEREGRVEHVLYWFQPATRWPRSESAEQLLRVWDALRGTPQYAFVRLSASTGLDDPEPPVLREFAKQLAPHVRAALNGEASRAPAGALAADARD